MAGRGLLAGDNRLMKMRPFIVSDPKPQVEPALNQRQIVQAALDLLDEVGFDGLTMRSLASKLGIQAASLYWHLRSKQELLSLLAKTRGATVAFAKSRTAEQLGAAGPEKFKDFAPTVATMIDMQSGHIQMHVGQLQVLRRKLGKPILF